MKLIIDAKKIASCLLKDGKVRKILFSPTFELYTVHYAFEEIEEHEDEFLNKVSKPAFELILAKAKLKIKAIRFSADDVKFIQPAKQIAAKFDDDDYPFLALALKLDVAIWTNDREIIKYGLKTGKYLALDTEALEALLKEKGMEKVKDDLRKKYAEV